MPKKLTRVQDQRSGMTLIDLSQVIFVEIIEQAQKIITTAKRKKKEKKKRWKGSKDRTEEKKYRVEEKKNNVLLQLLPHPSNTNNK